MKPQEKVKREARLKILKVFYDTRDGYSTFKRLLEETGMSRRTLAKHLKEMEQEGEVSTVHIGGKARIAYRLVYPVSLSRKLIEELSLLCSEPLTERQIEQGLEILSEELLNVLEEYWEGWREDKIQEIYGNLILHKQFRAEELQAVEGEIFKGSIKSLVKQLLPLNIYSLLFMVDLYEEEEQRFSSFPDMLEKACANIEKVDNEWLREVLKDVCQRPERHFLYKLVCKHGLKERFDALVEWIEEIKHQMPIYHMLDDWVYVRMGILSTVDLIVFVAGEASTW
jgi:DNA-binding HxlR family transcriptional regulator